MTMKSNVVRQSELSVNKELGALLSLKMPTCEVWTEPNGVVVGNRSPDILITRPGRAAVVIEAEFMPAQDVEREARELLGLEAQDGRILEAAIAVRYPDRFNRKSDIRSALSDETLEYAVLRRDGERFPKTGWLNGRVGALASMIRLVSIPRKNVAGLSRNFINIVSKNWNRPILWPVIAHVVVRYARIRLFPESEAKRVQHESQEAMESQDWCALKAIGDEELANCLPFPFVHLNIEAEHPDILQESRLRVEMSPASFGGAGNLDLIYSLARAIGASTIVETGVAYGWSSLSLLLALSDNQEANGRVFSIDLPYTLTRESDDWVGIAVPESLRSMWRLFRMADRQGLPRALKQAKVVDLAHYDSDKSVQGRAFGYNAIWKSLRKGGILVSDDIGDNLEFKRFSERVGRTPMVVGQNSKYSGILIK